MKKNSSEQAPLRVEIRNCYDETQTSNLKTTRNPRVQESHPEREILLAVSGKNNFLLNGRIYSASPGDAFFINHWIPHQCNYGTIKTDFLHIWIHIHAKRLFCVLCQNSPRTPKKYSSLSWELPVSLLAFLNERWDRALREPENSPVRREIYLSIARILAEEIAFLYARDPDAVRPKTGRIAAWIKNYISMQYGRNASLPELEKLTGYNRYYLMRLFKTEYGMTIGEYINCVRRGFAAAALEQGMRQKEIALQLGFRSAAAYWLWKNRDRMRKSAGKNPPDPAVPEHP